MEEMIKYLRKNEEIDRITKELDILEDKVMHNMNKEFKDLKIDIKIEAIEVVDGERIVFYYIFIGTRTFSNSEIVYYLEDKDITQQGELTFNTLKKIKNIIEKAIGCK